MFKKSLSLLLALTMVLSLGVTAFAEELSTSGADGETPVTLTAEAAVFSVTVPTGLPISVNRNGEVICAKSGTAKIINNSHGSVKVTGLSIAGINGWNTTDYDSVNMTKVQVNTKLFAFTINNEKTTGINAITFNEANFPVISGKNDTDSDELVINYNALVAPQNETLNNSNIANIVFTIGWDADENAYFGPYETNFADNTWADIIEAVQTNAVPHTWKVGDTKPMTINGKEYDIQIIGKNHDTYADGTGVAPLTFMTLKGYTITSMNNSSSNSSGWSGSYMRNTTLPQAMAAMPTEVQNAIKAVNKTTIQGQGKNPSNPGAIEITADKLFLLTESEVFGTTTQSLDVEEGTQYAYYANGGSTVKYIGNSDINWWLRSPGYIASMWGNNTGFQSVDDTGKLSGCSASSSIAMSFAFCF